MSFFLIEGQNPTKASGGQQQKNKEDEGEGVIIGPLDALPDQNVNGPQEKASKDLHQGNHNPRTYLVSLPL